MNSGQVFSNNFKDYQYSNEPKSYKRGYGLMGAEYMPDRLPNVDVFFHERGSDSIRSIDNKAKIENYSRIARVLSFDAKIDQTDNLELPLTYYKGYKADIDGVVIDVNQSEWGLVEVPVDKSAHVKVYFGGTVIQHLSPYITLIVTLLLIGYIIWFNRRKAHDK